MVNPKEDLFYNGLKHVYQKRSFEKDPTFVNQNKMMPKFLCIQDDIDYTLDDHFKIREYSKEFFQSKFNNKSKFEY